MAHKLTFGFLFIWLFSAISTAHTIPTELPIIIDVRTEKEFNQAHIKGAHLAPYNNIENLIAGITTNKDDHILLYCRSGRRAEIAKEKLISLGYTHVSNEGGIEDLKALNYQTVTP